MRTWKRAVFWVILVIVPVGTGEGLARLAFDPPALVPQTQEAPVIAEHPRRGYALRAGASGQYVAGGKRTDIRINDQGFRNGSYDEALRARLRLLAVGDSFTFGLGVGPAEPWPKQLEWSLRRRVGPGVAVVNAGVPGYSTRQMRETAEELIGRLRPQVILFGVNSETYWRVQDPYVYVGGNLVVMSALSQAVIGSKGVYISRIGRWSWLRTLDLWLNRYFELGAHLLRLGQTLYGLTVDRTRRAVDGGRRGVPPDPAAMSEQLKPMLSEIGAMNATARSRGSEMVVVLINPQERDGGFRAEQSAYNEIVSAYCRRNGILVVDPLPALAMTAQGRPVFRAPDDYHWTAPAHRIAAEQLLDVLTTERLLHGAWTRSPRTVATSVPS
jgi:lysophospholipase L1-like esterase